MIAAIGQGSRANNRLIQLGELVSGQHEETDDLAEIRRLNTGSTDLSGVLEYTADYISTLIPSDTISISIVDIDKGTYSVLYRWGGATPRGRCRRE